jgi:hypothetical protein
MAGEMRSEEKIAQFTSSGSKLRFDGRTSLSLGTGCMRKFALTAFAILYGVMVVSVSVERFTEWVAQEASGHAHFVAGQQGPSIGKAEKSQTYDRYRRIIERPFVVESPRDSMEVSTGWVRHLPLPCFQYEAAWNGWTVSLRAPPSNI